MNPGKTKFRVRSKDGREYTSQEFDSLQQAMPEILAELYASDLKQIVINSKTADESYLDCIKIEHIRLPKQTSFLDDLLNWWSK